MEEIKITGIILRTADHKESDKLAYILTPDRGKITALFRGVKKQNAKLKSFAQPLTFAEFLLVRRSGFYTVTSCALVDNFYSLAYDSERFFAACIMLEVGEIMSQENLADGALLAIILRGLKELTYSQESRYLICAKFLLGALAAGGYKLDFSACGECRTPARDNFYLDGGQGGAVCALCRGAAARPIKLTTLNYLRFVDNTELENLNTLNITDTEAASVFRATVWMLESLLNTKIKAIKNIL